MTNTLQALSLVEKAEPVQVRSKLRLKNQLSKWMQNGCTVYMDSYMASNGSCFMVTINISKNHLLEVGLTQNQKTMALRSLITVNLFYFIHVWGSLWIESQWNSIGWRARSHMASHFTWWFVANPIIGENRHLCPAHSWWWWATLNGIFRSLPPVGVGEQALSQPSHQQAYNFFCPTITSKI